MPNAVFRWSSAKAFFGMLLGEKYQLSRVIHNHKSVAHECLLPPDIGAGRMEFVHVNRNLKVVILDCTWHCKKTLRISDGGWIRFNFNKVSEVELATGGADASQLALSSWNVINIPSGVCSIERVKAGAKTTFLTAICSPEYASRISGIQQENLPKPLQTLHDEDRCASMLAPLKLTQQISLTVQQAIHTDLDSGLRVSFIAAKANELICLSLHHLLSQKVEYPKSFIKLTESDREKIRRAKAFLDGAFHDPPSIDELAQQVGINRNKLFYGFKSLSGRTISKYLQELRLKKGYELLVNSETNIGEIADRVGFKHQCNFSTAFRHFFGVTPNSLRLQAHQR